MRALNQQHDVVDWMTVNEAAECLGVSVSLIHKWHRQSKLKSVQRFGVQKFFDRTEIEALKASRQSNPPLPGRPKGAKSTYTKRRRGIQKTPLEMEMDELLEEAKQTL